MSYFTSSKTHFFYFTYQLLHNISHPTFYFIIKYYKIIYFSLFFFLYSLNHHQSLSITTHTQPPHPTLVTHNHHKPTTTRHHKSQLPQTHNHQPPQTHNHHKSKPPIATTNQRCPQPPQTHNHYQSTT